MAAQMKPRSKAAPKLKEPKARATTLSRPSRKRRGNGAAEIDSEAGLDEVLSALPSGKDLKAHIASLATLQSEMAVIRGNIGAKVKNAENDLNIHRQAAAFVAKLARMDPQKRADLLRHLRSYTLQMGWGEQANLFEGASAGTGKAAPHANV